MKNKEIKEILFDMDLIANHNKVPIYFTQNKVKLLLSYIEQLQKIPNKALNFIHENSYKKGEGTVMYDADIYELENILKGDSE